MVKKKPPTKTVRLHLDVAQMAEACAAAEGAQTPEWLSELLRPILKERLPKSVDKLLLPGEDAPPRSQRKSK